MDMEALKAEYELKKRQIKLRLSDFKKIRTHEELFYELCYCIMTANGSAKAGRTAQKRLEKNDFLGTGIIGECVRGVRYCENKKKFLIHNRSNIIADKIDLSKYFQSPIAPRLSMEALKGLKIANNAHNDFHDVSGNAYELREKIACDSRHFKGLGWKESSHFLRNIGFSGLSILDRHILKNLKALGAIDNILASLSKKTYLEIEKKLKVFCENVGIPMDEFDMLIWTHESGTNIDEAK